MENEKWKIPVILMSKGSIALQGVNACPPDATTPHGVNCMAQWGEKTGKLRLQIIVGSGAYVHRDTVEGRSSWTLLSSFVPEC
jgi:hypothetical protein